MKKITLDGEIADQITVATLKEHLSYLKRDLKKWNKNPKTEDNPNGVWMHPDDVIDHSIRIKQLKSLIQYFGG